MDDGCCFGGSVWFLMSTAKGIHPVFLDYFDCHRANVHSLNHGFDLSNTIRYDWIFPFFSKSTCNAGTLPCSMRSQDANRKKREESVEEKAVATKPILVVLTRVFLQRGHNPSSTLYRMTPPPTTRTQSFGRHLVPIE